MYLGHATSLISFLYSYSYIKPSPPSSFKHPTFPPVHSGTLLSPTTTPSLSCFWTPSSYNNSRPSSPPSQPSFLQGLFYANCFQHFASYSVLTPKLVGFHRKDLAEVTNGLWSNWHFPIFIVGNAFSDTRFPQLSGCHALAFSFSVSFLSSSCSVHPPWNPKGHSSPFLCDLIHCWGSTGSVRPRHSFSLVKWSTKAHRSVTRLK